MTLTLMPHGIFSRDPRRFVGSGLSVRSSCTNWELGVMNEETPQSKQTRTFGNSKNPELAKSQRLGKWILTSAGNSLPCESLVNIRQFRPFRSTRYSWLPESDKSQLSQKQTEAARYPKLSNRRSAPHDSPAS
jgi:hypothetical protein